MKLWIPVVAVTAALLMACGGSGVPVGTGDIAGIVYDSNGNPVRGAIVFVNGATRRETVTTASGSYLLQGVEALDVLVQAQTQTGSTNFSGQNFVRVFQGERARNVHIRLVAANQQAQISGIVTDRFGQRLTGVRVFAKPADGSIFTSSYAMTDANGEYFMSGLQGGVNYNLKANSIDFGSDVDSIVLTNGESRRVNFSIANPTNPILPKPTNVVSSCWTAPAEITRSREVANAVEAIKALVEPRRARKPKSRLIPPPADITVEVYWDPVDIRDVLGFAVSRKINNGEWVDLDFARDPYAELFVDSDPNLVAGNDYTYAIQTLSTSYDGNGTGQSDFSDTTTIRPLGQLNIASVSGSGPTFQWFGVNEATKYAVFVFDRYPSVGVTSIFDNFDNPIRNTAFVYNGPALVRGRTYFYVVLGMTEDTFTKTISSVQSFIAP